MAKPRTAWRCQTCGATAPRWVGRCSECGEFATYVEEVERRDASASSAARGAETVPVTLAEAGADEVERFATGIAEFDRVLGGGFVRGSLVLLGGEPGVGKSTLLLQAVDALAASGRDVLYVCGEESPQQVGLRARRLGAGSERVTLLPELDISFVETAVSSASPQVLVVDSIQTAFDPDLDGAPGSVGQVRSCTSRLLRIAKDKGVTVVIVGHVTKEGAIAGPRVLEHMVDVVLYFEGDREHAFRVVRSVKNRFGASDEIGVFEMAEEGLRAVEQPSALLIGQRAVDACGSIVMPAIEGSRPLLVEIQALVSPSYLTVPRRLSTGIEQGRLLQILAVLERHAGVALGQHDVYVAVSGGVRVSEPAADLPLALAIVSAWRGKPISSELTAAGEVALTGAVRTVPRMEARCREAARFGFDRMLAGPGSEPRSADVGFEAVARMSDALSAVGSLAASG